MVRVLQHQRHLRRIPTAYNGATSLDAKESAVANARSNARALHEDTKRLVKDLEKEFTRGRTQLAHNIGEALPDGPLKAKHRGVWPALLR